MRLPEVSFLMLVHCPWAKFAARAPEPTAEDYAELMRAAAAEEPAEVDKIALGFLAEILEVEPDEDSPCSFICDPFPLPLPDDVIAQVLHFLQLVQDRLLQAHVSHILWAMEGKDAVQCGRMAVAAYYELAAQCVYAFPYLAVQYIWYAAALAQRVGDSRELPLSKILAAGESLALYTPDQDAYGDLASLCALLLEAGQGDAATLIRRCDTLADRFAGRSSYLEKRFLYVMEAGLCRYFPEDRAALCALLERMAGSELRRLCARRTNLLTMQCGLEKIHYLYVQSGSWKRYMVRMALHRLKRNGNPQDSFLRAMLWRLLE